MGEYELFPREVVSGVPRMTLTGCSLLHIEQHRGLMVYQPEEMRFRTSEGEVVVKGEELRFRLYTAAEAVVTGVIRSVGVAPAGGTV